jgi:hypothetical protein
MKRAMINHKTKIKDMTTIQDLEHFDICLSKRALAVKNGAIEISLRELAEKTNKRDAPK